MLQRLFGRAKAPTLGVRFRTLSLGLCGLVVALLWSAAPSAAAAEQTDTPARMNIVLISIDTLRADHLGTYGYFRDTSPTLDGLAIRSIVFELCLTPMATTLPAHTSVMTATYPLEHGVLANVAAGGRRFVQADGLHSFAYAAALKGYRTAAFVSAAPLVRETGFAIGFQTFDEPRDPERPAVKTTQRALRWLKQNESEPFFMFLHYFDPHHPYSPPAPYDRRFGPSEKLDEYISQRAIAESSERDEANKQKIPDVINLYDGEIRYVDENIFRVLQAVKARGYWDRTAVIVMSDHGEGFGEHGLRGHGYVYREQLHVALMMRIPGQEPRRISTPMSLVDTLPTALSMIGGDWSDFLKQSSGADVLAEDFEPRSVFSQRTARRRQNLEKRGQAYALATDRWKYMSESKRKNKLYDWSSDPFELENVIGKNRSVAESMKSRLLELVEMYSVRGEQLAGERDEEELTVDPELVEKLRALGYVD